MLHHLFRIGTAMSIFVRFDLTRVASTWFNARTDYRYVLGDEHTSFRLRHTAAYGNWLTRRVKTIAGRMQPFG